MRLVICGDMSVTNESAVNFVSINPEKAFGNIREVFNAADRVIVNLECAVTEMFGWSFSQSGIKRMRFEVVR